MLCVFLRVAERELVRIKDILENKIEQYQMDAIIDTGAVM